MEATKYGVFTRSEEEKVSGKCTIKWEILFFLQFAAELFFSRQGPEIQQYTQRENFSLIFFC